MPIPVVRSAAHASPAFVRRLLQSERSLWTTIRSRSMTPLLKPGDRAQIQQFPPGRLFRGDLVALDSTDHIVVHRVVAFTPDRIVTKGDALPRADPPWLNASVLGRVVAVQHRGLIRNRARRRWLSALLGMYSWFLSRLRLPLSGLVWQVSRLPFYCVARFEYRS